MKFYLAASYARRREMQGIAAALEAFGHQVTSRWVRGDHELDDGLTSEAKAGLNARFAGEKISTRLRSSSRLPNPRRASMRAAAVTSSLA